MKYFLPFFVFALSAVFVTPSSLHDAEARERISFKHNYPTESRERPTRERTRNYENLVDSPTTVTTKKPVVSNETASEPEPATVIDQPVVPTPEPEPIVVVEPEPEAIVAEPELEPEPVAANLTYLERVASEIHRLTNLARTKHGLAPLAVDPALAAIAKAHSDDMISNDYFSHVSPDGCGMTCRLEDANYEAWAWGENIAWRQSSNLPSAEKLAEHFFENWMDSRGHRENILSEDYTHEGVGLIQVDDTVYITVNFAEPQ